MNKKIRFHWHSKLGKPLPPLIKQTRGKLMYQYRQEGWSLSMLAILFGLKSREAARKILLEYEKENEQNQQQNDKNTI